MERERLPAKDRALRAALCVLAAVSMGALGCSTFTSTVVATAVGVTAAGAYTPAHELEQIYYLGTFDPQGQVPPQFYRLTVRGQASIISNMRFGSGWVPANVVDSIEGWVPLPEEPRPKTRASEAQAEGEAGEEGDREPVGPSAPREGVDLEEGRALMQFGPEGFREAPRDHRLVIVMGGDPSAFFQAIDMSLGNVARVQAMQRESALSRELFAEYVALNRRYDQLTALEQRVERSVTVSAP